MARTNVCFWLTLLTMTVLAGCGESGVFPAEPTPSEAGTATADTTVHPQLRDLKAVPRTVIPKTEAECNAVDGQWAPQGLPGGGPVCSLRSSDRRKICTDSSQCQGFCLVADDIAVGTQNALGSCAEWDITYGCNRSIIDGKVQSWCGH